MSSDLGIDRSGNNNHFTVTNLTYSDQMLDSPTNNFATLNFLSSGGAGFFEGNLKYTSTAHTGAGTLGISSGKAYFEVTVSGASNSHIGVCNIGKGINPLRGGNWSDHGGITYKQNGDQYRLPVGGSSSTTVSYGASYTDGDIIGVAIDADNDTIVFYKNNASQGNAAAGPSFLGSGIYSIMIYGGSAMVFVCNFGQDSSFAGTKTAQGNTDSNGEGDFYYEPPSGFLALCTNNLPEPAVDPRNHFNTVLYTGDSASSHAITGVGFQPDLLWFKNRTDDNNNPNLVDSVRGDFSGGSYMGRIYSNVTQVEQDGYVESLDSDGFTLIGDNDNTNLDTKLYVAWNWKAGASNTAVTESGNNPGGTHKANVAAGFSIVSYVGTGAAGTVTHGLGAAPEMIIIKNRDVNDPWAVYHASNTAAPETDYLVLNTTAATVDSAAWWNDTAPTASVFTVATDHSVNADAENYIAYCFRSIEGYSNIGAYLGNSNNDGPFVCTGFRPKWLLITNVTDGDQEWRVWDSARSTSNVMDDTMNISSTDNEETANYLNVDFLSNGFKLRIADGAMNVNAKTHVFMAFAETPFKYANAK